MRGVLVHDATSTVDEDLVRRARSIVPISETDLVADTSVAKKSNWPLSVGDGKRRVVVVDCGVKENILRSLSRFHPSITVVPFDASASDILALDPSGIVVSNGPGDPIRLAASVATMKDLIGSNVPILGICLGHQILGLAIGATTSRLPFGHHGGNHPVLDVQSGRVHITSQNHEFQVDAASVTGQQGFFVSQVNLNDRSVEGLSHESLPIFSVQYHPEGAPGPQDNQYLFDRFISLCENKT
jgi:carbamoyl-phosphate synthase small subunit